jgi:hypothetical protein
VKLVLQVQQAASTVVIVIVTVVTANVKGHRQWAS